MGSTTKTGSVTLVPSGYTGLTNLTADSTYGVANGYTDSSSTNYARFTLGTSSTGYLYYTFDTSSIPSNATISSISARFKARVNNTSRVTNTTCQLYTNTTAKGSSSTFAVTTASQQSMTVGSWTRSELTNLRLRIGATGSSSTSTKRFDFYGADVTINYSWVETTYDVTSSISGTGTIDPSGTVEVVSGDSYTLMISGVSSPTVMDNNVNVSSQLVQITDETKTFIPDSNTNSNFTLTNISDAYNDATNTTYAQLGLAGSTTGTIYFDIEDIDIPSGVTITSVSCDATLQFNNNSSSSGFTASCQMYAGSTAKGSATTIASSSTAVPKTTFHLNVGSWSSSDLSNPRFYITATNSARSTQRYLYVYGVSFNVTYESDGVMYSYTISSVTENHTITVSSTAPSQTIYFKNNGAWVAATSVYKKVNGSWVLQSNLSNVFDASTNYVKGN